ncbi:MAG: hypothetical protein H3C48_02195 [Chitinophagaceae bacterium]|nr:hypothetical protein [Chitinophagaceae bacterium]
MAVKVNGIYNPAKKIFPVTEAKLQVQNGEIKTVYYPNPVQKINIITDIINTDGTLAGTGMHIQPVSFEFEGQPFMIKATINNPDDMQYDIVSDGVIDLGRIYKVFAVEGYDITGLIKTDLRLKGRQSDAAAGRYRLLVNAGQLDLQEVKLHTESFPQPFIVHSGQFNFKQDKMWFKEFNGSYGSSSFSMNGFLNNVINYVVGKDEKLHGKFTLKADYVDVKEFTAFAGKDTPQKIADTASGQGVVMIPDNLSVSLDAYAKKVSYDSLIINDFKGQLTVDSGKIALKDVAFHLIDAPFKMNASYYGETPRRAFFDFTIKADSFSIAKAYKDIPMFRAMASSASGVQGMTGLDYRLSGRLDENMIPVYPSLKGGGVLSLKNIKLMGFKLMNTVSRETEHEELKDADVKGGIHIKSTINNNIITIERVKLRIAGLRPRFEGQVSMDGLLNLKGRVGLPPLGIIGIPFTVSGTSDHPEVKLKRDKTGKVLQDTEDAEYEDEE